MGVVVRTDDGGSAFPVEYNGYGWDSPHTIQRSTGMSLRDWFAGQAIQGPVAVLAYLRAMGGSDFSSEEASKAAYSVADAMLKEREG